MSDVLLITQASRSVRYYLQPHLIPLTLWRHRQLIGQLVRRGVAARYRGSALGVLWSFLLPLVMLAVYTFVFSVILPARWGTSADVSKIDFALTLFCGLLIYGVFSEATAAATTVIIGNVSYVKKVVFPLEILPVVTLGTALVNGLFSLVILLAGMGVFQYRFPLLILYLPLVALPLVLLCLGLSWFLASVSVYLRDTGHVVTVVLQILIFLTPIFFPMSMVPAAFQVFMKLNPLSVVVESGRDVLLRDAAPDWFWLGVVTVIAYALMQLGYAWFMKTRRGFADVL
jgi:lipopolysaccharide transport system permease protein